MGQGGSKDKTAQMTEQNPITQGWPVHMRNILSTLLSWHLMTETANQTPTCNIQNVTW